MSRWPYILLLLPVFDLILSVMTGMRPGHGGHQQATSLLLGGASLLFGWVVLYFSLSLVYGVSNRLETLALKRLLRGFLAVLITLIAAYLVFYWSFVLANGFAPSDDAVVFLFQNLERLPQHILQTSPAMAGTFLIFSLVLGMLCHAAFSRTKPLNSGRVGLRYVGASAVVFLAWLVTAPYATSITPVQSMLGLTANDPMSSGNSPVLALEKKKPYMPAVVPVEQRGPVIVILVESLRRDLLEMSPSPIPFLASLTKDSILFDKAYATASHSNYADLAFWYSQYPLRTQGLQRYPKDAAWRGDSLFTAFKAHDYTTAYISSQNEKWGGMINWLKVDDVDYFYHSEDFQGDTWFNEDDKYGVKMLVDKGIATAGKIEDSSTIMVAQNWISSLKGRKDFFIGLNLQNTHFSYVIPPGGDEPFQPADIGFEAVYYRWPEEKKENVRNRYLNSVYNVDRILGRFVEFLKTEGLWDDCTFVVLGDSGEAFYEHGFGNHSGPMYDEVMRTFALLKPAAAVPLKGQVHDLPISHIDVAAAVLDLMKMPLPDEFQGVSPFAGSQRKPVFMHTNAIVKQNGIVDWPWKLLHTYYPVERLELYDLEQDTSEMNDLSAVKPDIAKQLEDRLSSWIVEQVVYYSDPAFYTQFVPPKPFD